MKLTKIEIHNYRNLDGLRVLFEQDFNFIVGENNLGKSNLLSLLNILFNSRSFHVEDFKQSTNPIEIQLQIKLDSVEIGHFQDLFDLEDYTQINIVARQDSPEEYITFTHLESEIFISPSILKSLNYVHYDSLRNPITEITFDRGRGAGRFLRNIISKYLVDNNLRDTEFLSDEKLSSLLVDINAKIGKIKSLHDFGVTASHDTDAENMLSKIIVLQDRDGKNFTKTGYGIQFLVLVTLFVLEKLQTIKLQRGDRGIFENANDKTKSISLVLGLDEPEIHLHPYMQRSLVKYLNSVMNNENEDFKTLVKDLFDIDRFIGQIIVVTHSPNIVLNNYKQIIRLFSEDGMTKVVCGSDISFSSQLEKHLHMQFVFFKEAFFSRCTIFVEGESEHSSFPLFGRKLGIDFDDFGICVIQAHGSAVQQLLEIASAFNICSIGISDKDDGSLVPILPNHVLTNRRDFDDELVAAIDVGKESVLRQILVEIDSEGVNREMQTGALNKFAHRKYGINPSPFTANLKLVDISPSDIQNLKAYYLTWFSINKSFTLGYCVGSKLGTTDIPAIYSWVITEAKKLTQHV